MVPSYRAPEAQQSRARGWVGTNSHTVGLSAIVNRPELLKLFPGLFHDRTSSRFHRRDGCPQAHSEHFTILYGLLTDYELGAVPIVRSPWTIPGQGRWLRKGPSARRSISLSCRRRPKRKPTYVASTHSKRRSVATQGRHYRCGVRRTCLCGRSWQYRNRCHRYRSSQP